MSLIDENEGYHDRSLLKTRRAQCHFMWHMQFHEKAAVSIEVDSSNFIFFAYDVVAGFLINFQCENFQSTTEKNQKCTTFIRSIEKVSGQNMISLDAFEWMKNPRACYFVWLYIQQYHLNGTEDNNEYSQYKLPVYPSNTKERFNSIVEFFDLLLIKKYEKISEIEQIKQKWFQVADQKKPFPWLEENNEAQCEWAWEYLNNSVPKPNRAFSTFGNSSRYASIQIKSIYNYLGYLQPITAEERYYAIHAFYDTWNTNKAEKIIFRERISKAWAQKKFRQSKESQKPLNTYLDSDTKKQLDKLTKHHNKNIHEMINFLIRQEYQNINNKNSEKNQ